MVVSTLNDAVCAEKPFNAVFVKTCKKLCIRMMDSILVPITRGRNGKIRCIKNIHISSLLQSETNWKEGTLCLYYTSMGSIKSMGGADIWPRG